MILKYHVSLLLLLFQIFYGVVIKRFLLFNHQVWLKSLLIVSHVWNKYQRVVDGMKPKIFFFLSLLKKRYIGVWIFSIKDTVQAVDI